jgi:hypothetical protein
MLIFCNFKNKMSLKDRKLCETFLANPNINPETGKRLRHGCKPYNYYVKMCKDFNMITNISSVTMSTRTGSKVEDIFNPYFRPKFLPEGFFGIKELDIAILLKLDVGNVKKLMYVSTWMNKIINSNEFINSYSKIYELCSLNTFETFPDLCHNYKLKMKLSHKDYIVSCLSTISLGKLDYMFNCIKGISITKSEFFEYVVDPIVMSGNESLLFELVKEYSDRFQDNNLSKVVSLILYSLGRYGNLDLAEYIIKKYEHYFYEIDLDIHNIINITPYVDLCHGAIKGNQQFILQSIFQKLIDNDKVNETHSFVKVFSLLSHTTRFSNTQRLVFQKVLLNLGVRYKISNDEVKLSKMNKLDF